MLALLTLAALIAAAAALAPFLVDPSPARGLTNPREAATPEGRFITVPFPGTGGLQIHYLERGPKGGGEPVFLLLHGFTLNAFNWGPVLDAFAARGRTIAYDQPPYGLSAKPVRGDWSGGNPYAKDAAIAQLFAVMDGLGLQRAILVGNSSGGTLAMEAALAHPDRVQALILIAPWVYAKRPTLPAWLAGLPQMRRLSLLIGRKLGAKTLLGFSYAHPERVTPERQRLASIHTWMAGWDLAWAELINRSLSSPVDVGQRLAAIRQPALVITGDTDKLVPVADTQRVSAALPDAALVVLPDCGHVPQEECPGPFMGAVGAWLDPLLSSGRSSSEKGRTASRIAPDVNADLQ